MNCKFDESRAADIIKWLTSGTPVEICAESAGVSKQTFYNWIKRGIEAQSLEKIPKSERPYANFAQAVKTTEANRIKESVTRLTIASRGGDLSVDKWFLERRCAQFFGQGSATTVNVGVGVNVMEQRDAILAQPEPTNVTRPPTQAMYLETGDD
jgi:transposase